MKKKIYNTTKESYHVPFSQASRDYDLAGYSNMMKAGRNEVPQSYMDSKIPMANETGQMDYKSMQKDYK